MTARFRFAPGLCDAGVEPALAALTALDGFRAVPIALDLDGQGDDVTPGADWARRLAAATGESLASWTPPDSRRGDARWIRVTPDEGWVAAALPGAAATLDDAIALIEAMPFEVLSLATLWPDEWAAAGAETASFGDGHVDHGWACAFRGAGHDRLVSRRWLAHGPWHRVIERPGDLTIVQFHDLAATPAAAYTQARPGHLWLGRDAESGYLPHDYDFTGDVKGLYLADRKTLEIVVPPGDAIELEQMRDACAIRARHRAAPPKVKPIERIAFVFLDEEDARAHLEDLWLRELECWYAAPEAKHRLDVGYTPPRA
jgi:hypothetical protein